MKIGTSIEQKTEQFLLEMISTPSLSGREGGMVELCSENFQDVSDTTEKIPMPGTITNDPYYCSVLKDTDYNGRHNLRITVKGTGSYKPIIFNAHLDVVPSWDDEGTGFLPVKKGKIVYGRGACDDKGSIAALFAMLLLLRQRRAVTAADIIIHLVCEEEVGGNGTLAILQDPLEGEGVVNMEPTDLKISLGHRGAVWFNIDFCGKSGHSGISGSVRNALVMAADCMSLLKGYHDSVLEASRNLKPFDVFDNPMPLTFGKLHSGDWPATVPSRAILEGVFGFLPDMNTENITAGIINVFAGHFGRNWNNAITVDFPFKNEPYIVNTNEKIVHTMKSACASIGCAGEETVLTSCADLWRYNHMYGIPGIQFGPGKLDHAHAPDEQVHMDDILKAAEIMFHLVTEY